MLNDNNSIGYCSPLKDQSEFVLNEYDGVKLVQSEIRPFKKWFEAYIGVWNDNDLGPCWNGVMHTNKNRIYKHDKSYFIKLNNEINKHNNSEVVHYAERIMAVMF